MSMIDRMFGGAGGTGGRGASESNNRRYGVDLATISNIDDPDKLNRVKCKRVTNDPDVGESDWMYVCSPMAGAGYGFYCMPKVGDLVLLSYLGGDVHRPFVIGSVWTQDVAAPYSIQGGKNETFSFKLPSGAEILFSEVSGKESVTIKTAGGYQMAMDGENKKITVADDKGKNALTLDIGAGAVTVAADQKLTLSAGSGASIVMDGVGGKITVKGNTAIEMSAAQLKAEMSGTCQIKANGQMSVESSGMTQVKGSMVKIN